MPWLRCVSLLVLVACTEESAPPATPLDAAGLDADRSTEAGAPMTPVDVGSPAVGDTGGAEDASPDLDATARDAGALGGSCPPSGPFGTENGAVVADAVLYDCDGAELRLHSLCDHEVSWVSIFADWCPPCRDFARTSTEPIWQTYQERIGALVVVTEDGDYAPATAELCREIRTRYGFTVPIAFDPTGAVPAALGVSVHAENVVLTRGMRRAWSDKYSGDAEVRAALDDAL